MGDRRVLGRMISVRLQEEGLSTRQGDYEAPGMPRMAK